MKYFKQHASTGGHTCCGHLQTDLPALRETSSLRETPPCACPSARFSGGRTGPGSCGAGGAGGGRSGAHWPGRAEPSGPKAQRPRRLRWGGTALLSAPGPACREPWPGSRSPSAPSSTAAPPAASTATGTGTGSGRCGTASSPGCEVPRAGGPGAGRGGEARAIPGSDRRRAGGSALVRGSGGRGGDAVSKCWAQLAAVISAARGGDKRQLSLSSFSSLSSLSSSLRHKCLKGAMDSVTGFRYGYEERDWEVKERHYITVHQPVSSDSLERCL